MKSSSFACTFFIFLNFFNAYAVGNTKLDLDRAKKLNDIIEKELEHLEDINSTLQYLGQALNKGAIKIENLAETRKWISEQQKQVTQLESQCSIEIPNEINLSSTLLTIRELAIHITDTVKNEFKDLHYIIVPIPTKNITNVPSLERLNQFAIENKQVISNLKEQAKIAGLTSLNLFARKLDDINNKYYVTNIIENIPLIAALVMGSIYFTPKSWIISNGQPLSLLGKIKNYLGDWRTEEAKELNLQRQPENEQGVVTRFKKFMSGTDYKALKHCLPLLLLRKESIPGYISTTQTMRNYWNHIKGYDIEGFTRNTAIDNLTLDDPRLVGLEGQIDELLNLVRYVLDPETYDRTNTSLEKGILLVGPSRCGKTLLARALRDTINKALEEKGITTKYGFKEVKWREITKWNDEGLKDIIAEAKFNAPCVVFIDEIHNLPLQTKEYGGSILTQFLTGMSGINSENDARHQIILLAATNQPEKLDSALLQPGRFGTIIRFEKPNYENRKKFFEAIFKYNVIDTSHIDIDSLARQTADCSYGDLETIVKSARFVARTLARSVTQDHLQNRIDQHVYRLKSVVSLTSNEKKIIAAHLAGHALVQALCDKSEKIELITIRGRWKKIKEQRIWEKKQHEIYDESQSKYGKIFIHNESTILPTMSKHDKEIQCKIALAGAIAEEILLGSTAYSYHVNDKQKALNLTKEIVFDGILEKDLPKNIQKELHEKAYVLFKHYEQEIKNLLVREKKLLEKITKHLENEYDLRGHQLQALIKDHKNEMANVQ